MIKWTNKQQQVIDSRNRDLLVSAAAGSGKTAVLVERIFQIVTDPTRPVDIDKLLIVTFTKAAAAEMRDRLYKKFVEAADAENSVPETPEAKAAAIHLRRQLQLVQKAQVCTIDSFCSMVVKNFGHEVDIDPAFRVGDAGELELLMNDVVADLLEDEYTNGSESFLEFAEDYASGKTDDDIVEIILSIYRFSESSPWPDQWRRSCLDNYAIESVDEISNSAWGRWYLKHIQLRIESLVHEFDQILSLCMAADGPAYCLNHYQSNRDQIAGLLEAKDYTELQDRARAVAFGRKPTKKKNDSCDPALDEQAKNRRTAVKDKFDSIVKDIATPVEDELANIAVAKTHVEELVRLTERFSERYNAAKKKKGIVSFSDVEHMALEILFRDGKRTDAAKQLAARYEEIMIDEYQDSNEVQETILKAVSREEDGAPNIFMVGDMKQSIYKFRMARPELFMQKYDSYSEEPSEHQLIELDANFRSRTCVIDSVNEIFRRIMHKTIGDIEYDRNAELKAAADYKATDHKVGGMTEILLLEQEGSDDDDELTKKEREARVIAEEIIRLTDPKAPLYVQSKEGSYRPVQYRDIIILLRASRDWDTPFQETLESLGIPCYTESSEGYFSAWEVQLVLNLLSCIDNPVNDVPLVSVLRSPLFSFGAEELSLIRSEYSLKENGNGFYGAMKAFLVQTRPETKELRDRVAAFIEKLDEYRAISGTISLSLLLRRIYSDLKLMPFILAMPGGARRNANLQALLQKAEDFENTSYHGIYHFIRYIEKLRKYSGDEGERNLSDETDNTVRIMTIHKSKGLEFPVVFVAGCGKEFNKMDEHKKVILHPEFGIGMDAFDAGTRTRQRTILRSAYSKRLGAESLGEELRVLYVAMTRAREKLYLTGTAKDLTEITEKYQERWDTPVFPAGAGDPVSTEDTLSYDDVFGASGYLDWILKAFRTDGSLKLRIVEPGGAEEDGADGSCGEEVGDGGCGGDEGGDDSRDSIAESGDNVYVPESLAALPEEVTETAEYRDLDNRLNYQYHKNDLYKVFATMSVSRLKLDHMRQLEEESEAQPGYIIPDEIESEEESVSVNPAAEPAAAAKAETDSGLTGLAENGGAPEDEIPRPAFLRETAEPVMSGADRGTLYHLIMEKIDPQTNTVEGVAAELDRMEKAGLISALQKDTINTYKILGFETCSLGARFRAAYAKGLGFRERQFIFGMPAHEVLPEFDLPEDPDEFVMIQGIIDMYFEEEDGLVLVDYKTDAVKSAEDLANKYIVQLDLYERALRQITGKPVKERWLYSFSLGKEIPV